MFIVFVTEAVYINYFTIRKILYNYIFEPSNWEEPSNDSCSSFTSFCVSI